MKWWGWGDEGVSFSHEDKPALGSFLHEHIEVDAGRSTSRPVGFDELSIPEPSLAGTAPCSGAAWGGEGIDRPLDA